MNDFLITVLKGLYPPYLLLGIWGIAATISARRWRSFDTLLLSCFIVCELFAALQVWIFYGELKTSRRYMWIAIPLYLPFAARGVAVIWDILKKRTFGRAAALAIVVLFAAFSVFEAYHPIFKWRSSAKKRIPQRISQQAAAWIRNDWKAPKDLPKIELMRCDQYQSGRRPMVQSELMRAGYLCGGQVYSEFLRQAGILPDYIVTQEPEAADLPGYVRCGTIAVEGQQAYIYKRAGGLP